MLVTIFIKLFCIFSIKYNFHLIESIFVFFAYFSLIRKTVKDTQEIGFFDPPMAWVALLCSLLLGFGDACFNTQIYSMLGGAFASNSVAAFAVFKFTQVSALSPLFLYCQYAIALKQSVFNFHNLNICHNAFAYAFN